MLSLSTWRDEKAVVRWRTHGEHHAVQEKGRFEVFEDYHLRVGEITADSHPPRGESIIEKRFDETCVGTPRMCTITEVTPATPDSLSGEASALPARLGLDSGCNGLVDCEVFESINNPGKLLLLGSWKNVGATQVWNPQSFAGVALLRHRRVRVIRDYSMYDRREAPQYYPEVKPQAHGSS